jgi:phage terminase Nu1 subunit (DNA packaging protein)
MAKKRMDDMDDELISGPALAHRLGLTPTTVSKLGGDGILVRVDRGQYKLWASVAGYVSHLRTFATGRDTPAAKARTRILRLQGDKLEDERRRSSLDWITKDTAIEAMSLLCLRLRTSMMTLPLRVAGRLPHLGREGMVEVDIAVRGVLAEAAVGLQDEVEAVLAGKVENDDA